MTFDEWWESLRGTAHISQTDRGYYCTLDGEWISRENMQEIFALISAAQAPKEQP